MNDYIELYNRGATPFSLEGWSVQYASANGTGLWQVTALTNFMLAPGQHYLVQESGNANGVSPLPASDATGLIALSATAGKVALVNTTKALSGACPTGASVSDLVGYGTSANCSETAAAPAPSTTKAIFRGDEGCADTGNNSADFTTGQPNPRNTTSPVHLCGGGGAGTQALTGALLPDPEGALPSIYVLLLSEACGERLSQAFSEQRPPQVFSEQRLAFSGHYPSQAFSEQLRPADSTRWHRDVWAYVPRDMQGVRPRPPDAWP
jgi:hypothetical protein